MSYPFSISKEVSIDLNKSLTEVINEFASELKANNRSAIEIKGNCIKILESKEFSSGSTLSQFNYGEIKFVTENKKLKIKARILLIEHFVFFITIVLGTSALLYHFGLWSNKVLLISTFLIVIVYVYFYLFPMMSFYSFFNNMIKNQRK